VDLANRQLAVLEEQRTQLDESIRDLRAMRDDAAKAVG
jgi:hypothetical protein